METNTHTTGWKPIEGWPDYMVREDGLVLKRSTNQLVAHLRTADGKEFVRLSRPTGKKATYTRVSIMVSKLVRRAFPEKDQYVAPICTDLSAPDEIWKTIEEQPCYMISSLRRVWSWKTHRFVGKLNGNGKRDVLFSDGTTASIDKLYCNAFGYNFPTLEGEEWRQSAEPGIFVSNLGRFYSAWNLELMKPQKHKGYLEVAGKPAHRLVALAFVDGRDLFRDCIDHINEVKTDNRAVNLRWCTVEENNEFYANNHPRV